jgi:hypothetical protein
MLVAFGHRGVGLQGDAGLEHVVPYQHLADPGIPVIDSAAGAPETAENKCPDFCDLGISPDRPRIHHSPPNRV